MHEISASGSTIVSGFLKGTTFLYDKFVTGGIESGQVRVSRRSGVGTPVR